MFPLIISPAAQLDAEEAIDYYQDYSFEKRNKFYDLLQKLYQNLQITPRHYSYFDCVKKFRSAAIIKFPYSNVSFVIDDRVYVVAIYNTQQNPDKLYKRIQ